MSAPWFPFEFSVSQVLVLVLVLVLVWALDLMSPGSVPVIHNRETELNQYLLETCPLLTKPYVPPLWGRSGHVQTWLYALIGRFGTPSPKGEELLMQMSDGSTASFKLFSPSTSHRSTGDLTLALCPGFCNHSGQRYVRTFVHEALGHGLRCATLNLLGAPPTVPLTAPRVFSYGCTLEFAAMVQTLKSRFPQTQLVLVGFSLGGNIVCKYLGEDQVHQDRVLCGLSVCQGYSASRAQESLNCWTQGRRFYNFFLTCSFRRLLLRHRQTLFSRDQDLSPLFKATALRDIDEQYIRRFQGYSSLKEYYETESCEHYLNNISVPLLLVNASDDPLVPPPLLQVPRTLAGTGPGSVLF
ncbi:monoacylglycerol lipase ABHD2-like isoform X2 [Boleophthalmus pectinirostris]|uniref:monoacylglycerol lipase ABHD2-like isoform X2 n=1 Tax=Boleophthalmus pectinirostris TaxID=150288 RepID=UPI000A1C6EC4|nr:monoacylglycerol lipase ABHD2-like isoform X2 [Boleophthalmus pectinirostris]